MKLTQKLKARILTLNKLPKKERRGQSLPSISNTKSSRNRGRFGCWWRWETAATSTSNLTTSPTPSAGSTEAKQTRKSWRLWTAAWTIWHLKPVKPSCRCKNKREWCCNFSKSREKEWQSHEHRWKWQGELMFFSVKSESDCAVDGSVRMIQTEDDDDLYRREEMELWWWCSMVFSWKKK